MHEKSIKWLLLRWLDSHRKGWYYVSEKALKNEFRLLLNYVEKIVGHLPDKKEIGSVRDVPSRASLRHL